jgi:lipoate synthase
MEKRPDWLKVRIPSGETYFEVRRILLSHKLNTICDDAMCPNIAECWGTHRTATFDSHDIRTRPVPSARRAAASRRNMTWRVCELRATADLKLRHAVISPWIVTSARWCWGLADVVRQIRLRDPDVNRTPKNSRVLSMLCGL